MNIMNKSSLLLFYPITVVFFEWLWNCESSNLGRGAYDTTGVPKPDVTAKVAPAPPQQAIRSSEVYNALHEIPNARAASRICHEA